MNNDSFDVHCPLISSKQNQNFPCTASSYSSGYILRTIEDTACLIRSYAKHINARLIPNFDVQENDFNMRLTEKLRGESGF